MKNLELLSPCGDMESLKVAVNNGADAVYLGAKKLGARAKINNFDYEELKEAVLYCHIFNVKVYLTINTLVFDQDFNEVVDLCRFALTINIDAFIIQDLGVFKVLKEKFPKAVFHASTQMAVHNLAGAKIIEELGFSRVVLSRETDLDEIKRIKDNTSLEIEFFVQGALCVSFSGNCYLSGCLFNESGNKGRCLQLCRLPFTMLCGDKRIKSGYLLSAKDMCNARRLKELNEAGVCSFKIEGRARRAAYVGLVTQQYRKIIDNEFNFHNHNLNNLKKAFNRGNFNEGYLNGNDGIIFSDIQGHIGVNIGKVLSFKKGNKFNEITLKLNQQINKGDSLKFLRNNIEICTISAFDIKKIGPDYIITTTNEVKTSDEVRLIQDVKLEEEVLQAKRTIPIAFRFEAKEGFKAKLTICDDLDNMVTVCTDNLLESAKTQKLSQEEAITQLSKMGDTPYCVNMFLHNIENVFMTKQMLNGLRRKACETLTSERIKAYNLKNSMEIKSKEEPDKEENDIKINKISKNTMCFTKILNLELIENYDYVIYYCNDFNKISIDEKLLKKGNIYLFLTPFLRNSDFYLIYEILEKYKELNIYCNNIGQLRFKNRKTILGSNLNIVNSQSLQLYEKFNSEAVVLGPDMNENSMKNILNNTNLPIFECNKSILPLMTLLHCPIKENLNCNCSECMWQDGFNYEMQDGKKLKLERQKLKTCIFYLKYLNYKIDNKILYDGNKIVEIF